MCKVKSLQLDEWTDENVKVRVCEYCVWVGGWVCLCVSMLYRRLNSIHFLTFTGRLNVSGYKCFDSSHSSGVSICVLGCADVDYSMVAMATHVPYRL